MKKIFMGIDKMIFISNFSNKSSLIINLNYQSLTVLFLQLLYQHMQKERKNGIRSAVENITSLCEKGKTDCILIWIYHAKSLTYNLDLHSHHWNHILLPEVYPEILIYKGWLSTMDHVYRGEGGTLKPCRKRGGGKLPNSDLKDFCKKLWAQRDGRKGMG